MNFQTTAALNHVYVIFAHYKDPHILVRLSGVTHSLRELTRDDWDKMNAEFDIGVLLYSDEAILLRHFLPRFLEWISDDFISPVFELWNLGYRLDHFRWLEWPAEEVEALRAVFEAWASELSTNFDAEMPIDFLVEIKENLIPYLEIWLRARPHKLAEWLWTADWKHHQSSLRWAVLPHVEKKLEAEFFRHPDGRHAPLLSRSIELIRSLRGQSAT